MWYCYLCIIKGDATKKMPDLLLKYYLYDSKAYNILLNHSEAVAEQAIQIAINHPELNADINFIKEAAMLHDIGIFLTNAPELGCTGEYPYICHGYLGRQLIEEEGLPKHALVCERHTGTGISREEILSNNLPLPHRDMIPQTIEEKIICFADKFYSKNRESKQPKTLKQVRKSLAKHGDNQVKRFDEWCRLFL